MPIDLSKSRRKCNEFCRWWKRDERDENTPDELIYKRTATGSFWAEEISAEQDRDNIVGGVFMFDSTHVTIRTPDNCLGMESKDLVLFRDEYWIVVSAQKGQAKKSNAMFVKDKYCSHDWYIELRK